MDTGCGLLDTTEWSGVGGFFGSGGISISLSRSRRLLAYPPGNGHGKKCPFHRGILAEESWGVNRIPFEGL